jgi:hypothetical protein
MRKKILLNFFFLSAFALHAQEMRVGDSVEISFLKMDKTILDASNLHIKIAYENIAKRPVLVYNRLDWGNLYDRFGNIDITVERQVNGKYLHESMPTYKINPEHLVADSLRHYDVPKKVITPLEKDTLLFDLLRLMSYFDTGFYRIKINLRIETIKDTTEYHAAPNGDTFPPEDKIKYITSDWIYFLVPKKISLSR